MRRAPLLALLPLAAVALGQDPPATFRREGGAEAMVLHADELVRAEAGERRRGRVTRTAGGWLDVRWFAGDGLDELGDPRVAAGTASAILDPVLDGQRQVAGLSGFFVAPGGARRFEAHRREGATVDLAPRGFRHHLREAIALNVARRDDYERRSGGRSRSISRRLVLLERVVMPWAWWQDRRGKRWNERGVQVIAGDFVAMRVGDPATAPRWRGRMSDAQREALEHAWGCHLAMTRHCVEQVGWAALNAATWAAQSGSGTNDVARGFVCGLRLSFTSAPGLDQRAQSAHEVGVGVLVNDLPEIPLAAALAGLKAARGP